MAQYLKLTAFAVVLGLVAFVSAGQGQPPPQKVDGPRAALPRWEYRYLDLAYKTEDAEKELNDLGQTGWEAISVVGDVSSNNVSQIITKVKVLLKRPAR